ncbi:TonB-dependent receptor [Sphingomonas sp. AP4-R1]|uniref:TonB-dependent receptor n=1 Tax=Sphingomonas sp. AP4-R1 TaxID=2735134 RepID=UPI0014937A6A|nr:TonB-dependent receptor [Sphingomonas sp. AP4-R1]QJU60337.1 TonB-dependent receptor [Sphingomonas sp. AP4-R1]
MRRTDFGRLASFSLIWLAPTAAMAADPRFAIPPASLDSALDMFAAQSGVDVGAAGAGIARAQSRGVRGRMPPARALDKLLDGTAWRAVAVPGVGFRLVPRPARPVPEHVAAAPVPAAPGDQREIVIRANKYGSPLLRYPGSVAILDKGENGFRGDGQQSLAQQITRTPALQSTALGAGRDKVFIRGIADSSFLGSSESTTGIYFGDVQLANNGPDPNLVLYDVERVEVLEGPQGTLYGAGAIGGVIRIVPRAADPNRIGAALSASAVATQGGNLGGEGGAMLNLPVAQGLVGLRLVGYHADEGGYVDDTLRGLRNINRTSTSGGRAAVRITPGDHWTIDASGVAQSIRTRDSQYGLRDLPGIVRRSYLAQPFEDDFYLGRLVVTKEWDNGVTLVSATGLVRADADDRFDATAVPSLPLAYDTHNRNEQVTQEVRLTRRVGIGGWVLGGSLLHDRDVISREFGSPMAERSIVGVTNRTESQALFGEFTLPLSKSFAVTAGARLSHARTDSDPSTTRGVGAFVRGRSQTRLDPTIGYSWLLTRHLAWYGRYEQAYRTGGLSVAAGIGRVANFDPDTISVIETGLRLERVGERGLSGSIAFSRANWRHIQADLVNTRGFPFTSNVGNGRIMGVEANLDWVPVRRLHIQSGALFADNRGFDHPDVPPGFRATRLPDTPRFAMTGGADYDMPLGRDSLRWSVHARYVGKSYLDPVALLNIRQGGYAMGTAAASWRHDAFRVDLTLDNVTNTKGDRFALGNPFGVAKGDQYTPLRPRNLRLAVSWEY